MSVKTIEYMGNLAVNTDRGPSRSIWATCPWEDFVQQPDLGYTFWDDFIDFPGGGLATNVERAVGLWNSFLGNNAACVVGNGADTTNLPLEGGVLGLTCSNNNSLSITLAAPTSAFRLISPATNNPLGTKLWFETSIAVGSVASGSFDFFVGLMDTGDTGTRITSAADLVFSAADTLKTASGNGGCIGFWRRSGTNPTDVAFVHNANNGTVQSLGATGNIKKLSTNYAGGAMAAFTATSGAPTKAIGDSSGNCFLKLGFIFDPNAFLQQTVTALTGETAGNLVRPLVRIFVNGKVIPVFYDSNVVQASTFPSTWMAPVIGFRSAGTAVTAGIGYVDWIRVAQLAAS